uniref:Uncharacterized protein n=1 Tax=Tanacetum cinerariifolium TaxID=118510 RepID=A0A6L2JY15_TANCI|nr:hypothetical protein [Tanacetum cinerariifolium]
MNSEEHDSFFSKLINPVDGEFKFDMEIPDTMVNDVIKKSAGYKYYKTKKGQSKEDNDEEESEEKVVSRTGRGRGKGYICSGNQEVNDLRKLKKDIVPRKKRTITYADNLIETGDEAGLLVKSISGKEQRHQQQDINKDDDIDDAENSKIEKFDDDSDKGDDDAAGLGQLEKVQRIRSKSGALSSINVPDAIEESVQANVLTEMKKQLPSHNNQINLFTTPSPTNTDDLSEMELMIKLYNMMYHKKFFETYDTRQKLYDILFDSMSLDQELLNAQDTEPSSSKSCHDDQDPPNDHEGEKRSKKRKYIRESSSKSSKKDKAPMDSVQDDIPIDKPQDKEKEVIQIHPNMEWFTKKSGIVDVTKRKSRCYRGKENKELIKKDELTIADLEGVRLEMLKIQYKNYVELEYHVDQLKAPVLEEAQWSDGDNDSILARKISTLHPLPNIVLQGITFEGIEDMISNRCCKKIHLYQVDAMNGIHHLDDMRKDFFKAEMGNRSTHKVYSDKRIITVVSLNMKKKCGYSFLTSIKVKRIDKKEYEFCYADLPRLNLNYIEDMYLLKVQGKLHHLKLEFKIDFINALLLYIRRDVIKNKIEDVQLGVESYQRTLNLTKPKFYFSGIDQKVSYTTSGTEKGVVYLNKHDIKSFMKLDEVHKFCDGT